MIQKITLSFFKVFLLFGIILFTESNTYAQSIVPDILTFDRICAGGAANPTYRASFTYTGYQTGTTFEVELSDKAGSFTTPTSTTTVNVIDDAANKKTIVFSIPSDIVGSDTYALRIKSSGGQPASGTFSSSTTKKLFPIYYKIHDQQYTINNFNGSAAICSGGSYVLSIDPDSTNPVNDSPTKYPSLSYNWYRFNGETTLPTLVQGNGGPTYTVTTPGTYYVETNYGTCTSLSYSNRVDVISSTSGSSVTISSSLGNPFCSSGTGTVLTATSGNSYVWKKDGAVITGATNRTYSTNESGVYTVDVDFGGCKASGSINLQSNNSFEASIDAEDGYQLAEGETITVSVTTDADAVTYEWYLNGNLIPNETSRSYVVAVKGNYTVKVSQASGCISTREFSFRINGEPGNATVIPNIIKLGGLIPYWDIPDEYKNANTKVMIISSNGDMVLDVVNYQGDWPQNNIDLKNVNPVYYYVIQGDAGEKKGSITVIK
ncbi:gliding motility protein SprC [Flavobacterium ustbae]|uniref:gliding motility protein SprC n=1 Tax=Flavobacterium ustbae TaxID=2488790 RepID=UPI000F7AE94D|nr:gliding motility protein SprC [Flavobacterium ustbae]